MDVGQRTDSSDDDDLGLAISELPDTSAPCTTSGVLVTAERARSPAYYNGLRAGTLILRVGEKEIRAPEDFFAAIKMERGKGGVLLLISMNGNAHFAFVKL